MSTKGILCRYYLSGVCQNGSNCKFSHDRSTGKVDNVCKYYLKGNCSYGKGCRYFHDRSRLNAAASTTSLPNPSRPSSSQPLRVLEKSKPSGNPLANLPKKAWSDEGKSASHKPPKEPRPLCPFAFQSVCQIENCRYIHGEECPICRMPRLHPMDASQRKQHLEECQKEARKQEQFERSKGRTCSICLEVILVESRRRVFGILSDCTHIYCLPCIRSWRSQAEFENGVRRSCPECRVHSHFVIPSKVWVSSPEEKRRLVEEYRTHLSKIPCQFFQGGGGNCPFYDSCFYKHQYANGERPKYRHLINQDGEYETSDSRVFLSDFLKFRDEEELAGQEEFLWDWEDTLMFEQFEQFELEGLPGPMG